MCVKKKNRKSKMKSFYVCINLYDIRGQRRRLSAAIWYLPRTCWPNTKKNFHFFFVRPLSLSYSTILIFILPRKPIPFGTSEHLFAKDQEIDPRHLTQLMYVFVFFLFYSFLFNSILHSTMIDIVYSCAKGQRKWDEKKKKNEIFSQEFSDRNI